MPIKVIRETYQTPEHICERLARAGGLNPFGEPNYRAVWGWSRLTPIGGKWEDVGRVEMRMEPKYPQLNRWHIERWMPPEVYGSPASWELETTEAGMLALGPYPSRGEYEHCFTLEGPKGEFIQLTPMVVDYVARAIEFSRTNWNKRRERKRLYEREAKNEDDYMKWAEMVLDDNPTWVCTPHTYLPANLKEKIA